jgi:hypothetical protein
VLYADTLAGLGYPSRFQVIVATSRLHSLTVVSSAKVLYNTHSRVTPAFVGTFRHLLFTTQRQPLRYFVAGLLAVTSAQVADMERLLIWIGGDAKGWACSICRWKFPVPTLLTGEEAKGAYDRLAAAKFREHTCEAGTRFFAVEPETKLDIGIPFAERARTLIKRGYTPKIAADLVLHEMEFEHSSNSTMMEKARADAEDFLLKVRKGLI